MGTDTNTDADRNTDMNTVVDTDRDIHTDTDTNWGSGTWGPGYLPRFTPSLVGPVSH